MDHTPANRFKQQQPQQRLPTRQLNQRRTAIWTSSRPGISAQHPVDHRSHGDVARLWQIRYLSATKRLIRFPGTRIVLLPETPCWHVSRPWEAASVCSWQPGESLRFASSGRTL